MDDRWQKGGIIVQGILTLITGWYLWETRSIRILNEGNLQLLQKQYSEEKQPSILVKGIIRTDKTIGLPLDQLFEEISIKNYSNRTVKNVAFGLYDNKLDCLQLGKETRDFLESNSVATMSVGTGSFVSYSKKDFERKILDEFKIEMPDECYSGANGFLLAIVQDVSNKSYCFVRKIVYKDGELRLERAVMIAYSK